MEHTSLEHHHDGNDESNSNALDQVSLRAPSDPQPKDHDELPSTIENDRIQSHNINFEDDYSQNEIPRFYEWVASTKKYKEAQEYLMEEEINKAEKRNALFYRDEDLGHTALVRAILKQSTPISLLKVMIKIGGADLLEVRNHSGWNVLHWAAYSNHVNLEVFKLLLQKCSLDVLSATNNYGNTPLAILLEKNDAAPIHKIQAIIAKEQQLMSGSTDLSSNSAISSSVCNTISWARELPISEQIFVFKNNSFKNMLNAMFISPKYLFVAMADFYVQFAIVIVYSYSLRQSIMDITESSSSSSGSGFSRSGLLLSSFVTLIVGFIWFVIRKTTQLMTSYLKTFFLDPANVLDIIQFVLLMGSIMIIEMIDLRFRDMKNDLGGEGDGNDGIELSTISRIVFTSATCVTWLKLLLVIGNLYYSVAVFVTAVIVILGKIIPFLCINVVLILMVSHMYLMWSTGQQNLCGNYMNGSNSQSSGDGWICDLNSSYTETFAMFFSLENEAQSSHSAVSFINGFIISILMLNILIAVISNYIMMALEKGNNKFWMNRLQFITECQSFFSLFSFLCIFSQNDDFHELEYTNHEDNSRGGNDDEMRSVFADSDIHGESTEMNTRLTKTSTIGNVRVGRISFGKLNKFVYKKKLGNEDKRIFFRWWFDQWKHEPRPPTPSLITRLKFFLKRATLDEIMFPAKEFENILIGIQYNKRGKGYKLLFARVASYFLSVVNIILVTLTFALGSISFGFLWHPKMKQNLFCVEVVELSMQVEKTDELKKELLENFDEYDKNQDKKLEKIIKKQEENGKRQMSKMSKNQKEIIKTQIEHDIRFITIDKHLAEIKIMIAELGKE